MTIKQKYGYNSRKRNYLGFVQFGFDFMPFALNRKYGISRDHWRLFMDIMKYNPGMIKEDRLFSVMAYREFAKTTWLGGVLPVYFTCMQGDIFFEENRWPNIDFCHYKTKTSQHAIDLIFGIQKSLLDPNIKKKFGDMVPNIKDVKDGLGKNQAKRLVTKNGIIHEAAGIDQPSRGRLVSFKRIKYAFADDVENRENTATPERREANRKEIMEEMLPAVDSRDGMFIYVGNNVHQNALIHSFQNNPTYKNYFFDILIEDKSGKTDPDNKYFPGEKSAWPQKFNMYLICKKYESYKNDPEKGEKVFYQEYRNRIITDIRPIIKQEECKIFRDKRITWIKKGDVVKNLYVSIGVDPAQSKKSDASDSAIAVLGMDSWGDIYLLDYFLGKLDLLDKFKAPFKRIEPFPLKKSDLDNVYQRGVIDETLRWIVYYSADSFTYEVASQQRGSFEEICTRIDQTYPDYLASCGYEGRNIRSITRIDFCPIENKIVKLRNGVMRNFEAGRYTIITSKQEIVNIIKMFPYVKLDLLDAMHNAEIGLQRPPELKYDPLKEIEEPESVFLPDILCQEKWIVS